MSNETKKTLKKVVPKWYKKMSTWQFIGYIFTPIAVTGEGAILALNLSPLYHTGVLIAVIVTGYVKYKVKDVDGDGLVD